MNLSRLMIGVALALSWVLFGVSASTGEPAGDQVWMNRTFRFGSYDFRIIKVEWLRANGYLVPLGQPDPDGKGALVLTIVLRNAGKIADHLPSPDIQVIFKDGTQTSMEARFPYDATGRRLGLEVYNSGDGPTVRYIIASVPEPTASNPVARIILSPRYSGDAGPGVVRFYNPSVVVVP